MYNNIKRFVLFQAVLAMSVVTFAQADLAKGNPVPDFQATSIDDPALIYSPATLKGKVYLVDFWASWCAPCVKALPHLQEVYNSYKDKGFIIVSLSMDQSQEAVSAFRKRKYPMPWFNAYLKDGLENSIAKSFNVSGLPAAFLIDKNGKIIATNKELEGDKLDKLVEAELGK